MLYCRLLRNITNKRILQRQWDLEYRRFHQKRIIWKREALLLLMYINLAIIIRFSFFPRDFVNGHIQPLIFDAKVAFPFRINIIPLVNLFQYDSVRDQISL